MGDLIQFPVRPEPEPIPQPDPNSCYMESVDGGPWVTVHVPDCDEGPDCAMYDDPED